MLQNNFIRKGVKLPPPKHEINNTPIRQRDYNKENHHNHQNKHDIYHTPINMVERDSLQQCSESSVANSRTVPKRRMSNVTRRCVNHGEMQAQFQIQIDGENLNYCSKCAAHLASNGFRVQRITASKSPRRVRDNARSPAFSKRRQELKKFMDSLQQVEECYEEKEEQLAKIQQSHEIEKQTITNFYSSLFEYLEYIREEHLTFIDEQAQRNSQLCQIEADEIGQTVEELKAMREDIETNVDKIVEEVDHQSYLECMTYYNQKKEVHEHRLSELGVDSRPAACTTAECVDEKLRDFKTFIDDLTGIMSSKADSIHY